MSAICGIYYNGGRPVKPETGAAMMRELGIYHVDTTGTWQDGQVFFGCQAQHITPESVLEILPYHDDLAGLTIAADAIIDNRGELCDNFGIAHPHRDSIPDSLLIMQAYQKWRKDCPKYLLGDFAFAIWDEKMQELFCAVCHTGTRTFYYYHSAGLFVFSTLIKPLFVLPEVRKELSEIWIADFLAIPSVMHQIDPELTIYQNVYMLPAGHSLTVRPQGAVKQVYWQVERQSELKLKSDGEYEEAFREVLSEAVRCRLRSTRPVGVMLSGGLDSTTVACLAARELAKGGRRLQAFSAVPMLGYRNWLPSGYLADETPNIEAVREHTGNIDVTYCRSEGKHSLSDTDRLSAMLEQPYKNIENMFWVDGIMASAKKFDIGVILYGAAGNTTISWGYAQPYLLSLFRTGRWGRLFVESWAFARTQRHPLRAMLRLVRPLLLYDALNHLYRLKNRHRHEKLYDLSPINPEFARSIAVQERLRRAGFDPSLSKLKDSSEMRQEQLSQEFLSHLGVITTKLALAYGVAWRDPTMDKRVIEFCLSVPESQYVRDGRDRFLLRRAMSGLLPDKVLLKTLLGRQSADWVQRLQVCWPEISNEISKIGARNAERKYLDLPRIHSELMNFNILNDDAVKKSALRMLIRSLIFSRFLNYEEIT